MILDVSKGHIKVEFDGRRVTVPGEMFFPPNNKMGFAIFKNDIKYWDKPNENMKLSDEDISNVINDIKIDFEKGGHTLEIE